MAVNNVVPPSIERLPAPALQRDLIDQRGRLAGALAAILASASMQDVIARRSYWHPNGFAKLVLDKRPRAGELRLHVWPHDHHDDDIHGHAWAYESIVVAGELTEVAYVEAAPGEGQEMSRHSYWRVRGRQFAFDNVAQVHLSALGKQILGIGDLSGGTPHHVHRFYASRTPAVTLLRVGPSLAPTSAVYRETPDPPPITTPRPTTSADVRGLIDRVAQLITR